jgi:hypothetical protein
MVSLLTHFMDLHTEKFDLKLLQDARQIEFSRLGSGPFFFGKCEFQS